MMPGKFFGKPDNSGIFPDTGNFFLVLIFFLFLFFEPIQNASFYGQSYIKLPFRDDKNRTEIELRFKTHQPDAFLLLAAGSSDYCLLFLERAQLAIKINFGSGETFLSTDNDLLLNDLQWHHVKLKITPSSSSLMMMLNVEIDEKKQIDRRIKSTETELNILYGVFLGSQEPFKSLYLGDIKPLRGCLDEVYFNGKNLLEMSTKLGITHEVSMERCDEVFSSAITKFAATDMAPDDSAIIISFIRHDSYVLLPGLQHYYLNKENEEITPLTTLNFELKSISRYAIIFFNPGKNLYKKEFLTVEIIDYKIKVSINDGNKELKLYSSVSIRDSHWHHVQISFDGQLSLSITVDGQMDKQKISTGKPVMGKLSQELFVGGLSYERQSLAVNYGLESFLMQQNVSLKGCLRNIKINSRPASLLDAIATKQIMTGKCKWQFFCIDQNKSPCIPNSLCIQPELNRIKCACQMHSNGNGKRIDCIKNNFKHKSIMVDSVDITTVDSNEFVKEKNCQLPVVQIDMLSGSTVSITNQIRDSIITARGGTDRFGGNKSFDLFLVQKPFHGLIDGQVDQFNLDILHDEIRYVNDNSHGSNDSIIFELIQKEGKKSFGPDAKDDGVCRRYTLEMMFKIHSSNDEPEEEHSNEVNRKPVIINTGLVMAHRTFSLITSSNLSLQLDSPTLALSARSAQLIKYELLDAGPRFGIIQKLRLLPNHWVNVSQFTQRQVDRGKIRYWHRSTDKPESDHFHMRVLYDKKIIYNKIMFQIKFIEHLEIVSFGSNQYNFSRNEKEFLITQTEMSFQTKPVLSDPQMILIHFRSMPLLGTLYLLSKNSLDRKLEPGSRITQKDVDEKRILYVRNSSFLNIDSTRDLVDRFEFFVTLDDSENDTAPSRAFNFSIYFENSLGNYVLVNRKLSVKEGEEAIIDHNHLYLRSQNGRHHHQHQDRKVVFEVTRQPRYGILTAIFDDRIEVSPTHIPQSLIEQRKLSYKHDDSENNIDFFDFSIKNFTEHGTISSKFSIEIAMKNDNPPVRRVNRTLNVIRGGERILSGGDLSYTDADSDGSPSKIRYTIDQEAPNGRFIFVSNGSHSKFFTQQDIDDGLIKFQHTGNDLGLILFSVTDGLFVLADSLLVKASEPYIDVKRNAGIFVKYGEASLITAQNLTIETNLPKKDEIFIKLITEPSLGQVIINDKPTNHFALTELEQDLVEYESTVFEDDEPPVSQRNDSFEFRVFSNDRQYKDLITKSYQFTVRIFPMAYFNINMVNQKNLTVFEDGEQAIDSNVLLVDHGELRPEEIFYQITENPKFGVIKNGSQEQVSRFTQQDVNYGRILYKNVKSIFDGFSDVDERDLIVFDVGTEVFQLSGLVMYVELIPKFITLTTSNLTVKEGDTITLTRGHIHLTHSYYEQYVDEFIVVEAPKYGTISLIGPNNIKLSAKSFTGKELDSGKICYQHDSSEYEKDWFTVVARANGIEKESLPATVHIHVLSINDEAPKLVNKTDQLTVWKDEIIQINQTHLAAIDDDSTDNEIQFLISMPMNGYLINMDTNSTVDKFTQAELNGGKIYFVHVGIGDGSFRYQITDGKNFGPSGILKLKVNFKKIIVDVNEKLLVTPGSQQSITNRHLHVSSVPVVPDDQYVYRIIKAPNHGRIILEGFKNGEEISFFTQQQVDENLVLYDQNVPISDPIVRDRIVFDIDAGNGLIPTMKSVHFIIEISVVENSSGKKSRMPSGMSHTLMYTDSLAVTEGKFKEITFREIDLKRLLTKLNEDSIMLKIIRQPVHGIILRNGMIFDNETVVPISAIRNRSIVYMHDDSNSHNDTVQFAMFSPDNFLIPVMDLTVFVRILPVNDEYPVVMQRNPRLKANFATTTLITRDIFYTRDDDGDDSKIIYLLKSENVTKDGFLAKNGLPTDLFTQQDVNDKLIYFVHQGTSVTKFLFWFRVKDDDTIVCEEEEIPTEIQYQKLLEPIENSHCTPYFPFLVTVDRFSVHLVNLTTIQLEQGTWRVVISSANLAVKIEDENLSAEDVVFRIQQGPFNGHIEVENRKTVQFSQKQIDDGQVYYVQENRFREDTFTLDIFQREQEKVVSNVNVKIMVIPLVKARKPYLAAYPGRKSLLTTEHLDASELASRTNSIPKFTVIKNPNHGKLSLLSFGANNLAETINEFSQEDIVQNRIVYMAHANLDLSYPNEIMIDLIEYELSAVDVQSAHGVLVVNIFNNHSSDELNNNILMKNDYLSYLGITLLKEQFILVCFLVLFLLLLIPTLFIIFRMCLLSWPGNKQHQQQQQTTSKCHKNLVAQTLTCQHHHQPPEVPPGMIDQSISTGASSSCCSHRHIDTSSHYSSSTGTCVAHSEHSNRTGKSTGLLRQLDDHGGSSNKISAAHIPPPSLPSHSFIREEMSPLPPPSLYFINDQSFEYKNHQWEALPSPPPSEDNTTLMFENQRKFMEQDLSLKAPRRGPRSARRPPSLPKMVDNDDQFGGSNNNHKNPYWI